MVDADGSVPSVNFRFAKYANGKRHKRCGADTRTFSGSVLIAKKFKDGVSSALLRVTHSLNDW